MTKKEPQAQINFLISELERLRNGYNKLSDEAFNDKIDKIKYQGMWRKADEKAERYGGLLFAIKNILNQESVDEDDAVYRLDGISRLIDDWYEEEIIK